MARRSLLLVPALLFALALAAWSPAVTAGTAEAPEITDDAGDQELIVVPVGLLDQFTSADLLAVWIGEDADNLYVNIQVSGTGTTSTTTLYSWTVHMTVDGADQHATATSTADQPTPSDLATAASLSGSVVNLTIPKAALGATAGTAITGIAVESEGNLLELGILAVTDDAPDGGEAEGATYTVTGGPASGPEGTPGDADGDGLTDTREVQYFGNVSAQNGTGDPDGDTLNNTAEFAKGTDPTKADTDGDGLSDKDDPFPLDPNRPDSGDAGNETDSDGDGLPDGYEREHFGGLTNTTGSADPDGDGLNNTEEAALGTDPTKADTDGDGVDDGSDPAPLDATVSKEEADREPELYLGAPMFAAIATLCLIALARIS